MRTSVPKMGLAVGLLSSAARWVYFTKPGRGLALCAVLAACADRSLASERDASARYMCEGGALFTVEFFDGQVRVTTGGGVYDLDRRPSSIGHKYSLGETTFIIDDDRAVLTGTNEGKFKDCHEIQ